MAALACGLLTTALPAAAGVELRIHYTALQRILAEQMFTQDGRRYVRGAPGARCNYAYLDFRTYMARPAGGSTCGRRQRTLGLRSVRPLRGNGDSFDLSITALPYFEKGAIRFRDVLVESKKDSFYIRRVRAALASTLRSQFAYKAAEDAQKFVEEKRGSYTQELSSFHVSAIQATGKPWC